VAGWFGVVYAGCAVVPVPILSAPPELAFRLEHAGCGALLCDGPRATLAGEGIAQSGRAVALLDLREATEGPDAQEIPVDTAPDTAAMILYTSGTTGTPKGACITHASLATHTAALVHHTLGLDAEDRVMGVLPLTHSFGLRMAILAPFYAGARAVLSPRFHAETSLVSLADEAVSWLPAVPTMFAAWARARGGPDLPRLRWCLSAGAPLPEDTRREAEARLGAPVREGYGLTEATFSTVDAPPDPPTRGSVGRPVWGVEVRIVEADGHPLPAGSEGEIVVRGQNVMSGYLDDAAASGRVLRGGWLHTGDVGRMDAEGHLFVVDRMKDLILRGGANVYPSEVENALAAHPGVAEVAVVGRPDPYLGEEVVAVVVRAGAATTTAEELIAFARTRIARNKVPEEVAFVERMPLGPSGKVLKRELREKVARGDVPTVRVGRRR